LGGKSDSGQKSGSGKDGVDPNKGGSGRAQAQEISAGGVVVRGEQVVVIVPTRRAANGSQVLALPKGHVDPGETPLQAATREVREEAGVVAEVVCELGESRYWYRRDGRTVGKHVTFYLFEYVEGDTADHDDEVVEARWIDLREAQSALSYDGERRMVTLALDRLVKGS
jgi:8-oxo-dGTP pyrophosphatase MutT (NUDIX family)